VETPRISYDDYTPYSIGRDKIVANAMVAELMREYVRPGHEAVALDTKLGLTSAFLKAATGVERVHVPNPSRGVAEIDGEEGCEWHQLTFQQFLRDVLPDMDKPMHYWVDYCCTVRGNSATNPAADLELLLMQESLPREGGVLAVTFCSRGVVGGAAETMRLTDELLFDLGIKYGYCFERKIEHVYGANGAKMLLAGYVTLPAPLPLAPEE
jgi:hypothetical protein